MGKAPKPKGSPHPAKGRKRRADDEAPEEQELPSPRASPTVNVTFSRQAKKAKGGEGGGPALAAAAQALPPYQRSAADEVTRPPRPEGLEPVVYDLDAPSPWYFPEELWDAMKPSVRGQVAAILDAKDRDLQERVMVGDGVERAGVPAGTAPPPDIDPTWFAAVGDQTRARLVHYDAELQALREKFDSMDTPDPESLPKVKRGDVAASACPPWATDIAWDEAAPWKKAIYLAMSIRFREQLRADSTAEAAGTPEEAQALPQGEAEEGEAAYPRRPDDLSPFMYHLDDPRVAPWYFTREQWAVMDRTEHDKVTRFLTTKDLELQKCVEGGDGKKRRDVAAGTTAPPGIDQAWFDSVGGERRARLCAYATELETLRDKFARMATPSIVPNVKYSTVESARRQPWATDIAWSQAETWRKAIYLAMAVKFRVAERAAGRPMPGDSRCPPGVFQRLLEEGVQGTPVPTGQLGTVVPGLAFEGFDRSPDLGRRMTRASRRLMQEQEPKAGDVVSLISSHEGGDVSEHEEEEEEEEGADEMPAPGDGLPNLLPGQRTRQWPEPAVPTMDEGDDVYAKPSAWAAWQGRKSHLIKRGLKDRLDDATAAVSDFAPSGPTGQANIKTEEGAQTLVWNVVRHFLISTSTALTPREALGVVGDNQAAITVLTGVKGGAIGNPFLVGSVVLTWLAHLLQKGLLEEEEIKRMTGGDVAHVCKGMTLQKLREADISRPPNLADYGYALHQGAPSLYTILSAKQKAEHDWVKRKETEALERVRKSSAKKRPEAPASTAASDSTVQALLARMEEERQERERERERERQERERERQERERERQEERVRHDALMQALLYAGAGAAPTPGVQATPLATLPHVPAANLPGGAPLAAAARAADHMVHSGAETAPAGVGAQAGVETAPSTELGDVIGDVAHPGAD